MGHDGFNSVMADLTQLLEKRAMEELSGGKGSDIVNTQGVGGAEIGSSTKALPAMAKGEVPLGVAAKDVEALSSPNKDTAYQAKAQHNAGGVAPASRLSSLNAASDKPKMGAQSEKVATDLASRLLYGIDALLNQEKVAYTLPQKNNPLAQIAIEKEASRRLGQEFAEEYLRELLTKSATDTIGELQPALSKAVGRGEMSDATRNAIVDKVSTSTKDIQDVEVPASVKKQLDPHKYSENKSPESVPTQPTFEEVKPDTSGKGEDLINKDQDQMQAVKSAADLMVAKAQLYDELMKAAESGDPASLAVAKSNIVDFLNSVYGG